MTEEMKDFCNFESRYIDGCRILPIPERILSNLSAAIFSRNVMPSSAKFLENCAFETVILLLCEIGALE